MEKLSLLFDGVLLENKPLYHYTNTDGFLGIIKNNQIWATDYKFLKDPSEHSYGHALVKEVIEELIKEKK